MIPSTTNETYVFLLCLIVFIMLAGFSAVCLGTICRMRVKLIRYGDEDISILKEYEDNLEGKKRIFRRIFKFIDVVVSFTLFIAFVAVFSLSLYINWSQDMYFDDMPTYRVVKTESMATVHEKNSYLNDLGVDNRIQQFDLIATYQIPAPEDIQLYDIVVYEVEDYLIIHRVVGIEPPNEKHPDEYYFTLQGDAVETVDKGPVLYSQLRAVYRGERIPFIGTFVLFMQSPAGWLCMVLVLSIVLLTPLIDRIIIHERRKRLREIY